MSPERLTRRLERGVSRRFVRAQDLQPAERRPAALLSVLFGAVTGAFLVGRAARDALFLSNLTAGALPRVYVASAIATALAIALALRLASRARPAAALAITVALFGSCLFGARVAIEVDPAPWLWSALYVAVDAFGAVALLQLWILLEDALPGQIESRLFELVDAATLGVGIVAGAWVWLVLRLVTTPELLVFGAGFAWLAAVPAVVLAVRKRQGEPVRPRGASELRALLGTAISPHLRATAAVTFLGLVALVLVDFQWKTLLAASVEGRCDRLAELLGLWLVLSGVAGLVVQLAAAPLLRHRFGVTSAFFVVVVTTVFGAGCVAVAPVLWAAAVARSLHESFRLSSHEATLQRILQPVPRRIREQAQCFLEELVRPAAVFSAGWVIAWLGGDLERSALVTLGCLAAFLLALLRLRSEHARSLGLARRRWEDPADLIRRFFGTRQDEGSLERALQSGQPREIENALELASVSGRDLSPLVIPHLEREEPRIRSLACDYLGRRKSRDAAPHVYARIFQDPDSGVRADAVRALCAIWGADATADVLPLLDHPDPAIVGAAVVGIASAASGLGGGPALGIATRFAASPDPLLRASAARALGALGVAAALPETTRLLSDPDPRVRRAAVEAAGQLRDARLVRPLLERLEDHETARAAEAALACFDVRLLDGAVRAHGADRVIATRLARVLGRVGSPEAVAILVDELSIEDGKIRGAICEALARAVRARPELRLDRERLRAACLVEIGAALRALAAAEALELHDSPQPGRSGFALPARAAFPEDPVERAACLVAWALDEKYEHAAERIFFLLAALHPESVVSPPEAARRTVVVEALASALGPKLARGLLDLFSAAPRLAVLRTGTGLLRPPARTADEWILELLADEDPWAVTAATCWAGAHRLAAARDRVVALLERPDPLVRETALEALEALLPVDELPRAVAPLLWDEFEPIRKRVDRLLERIVDEAELRRARGKVERVYT